MKSIVWFAALAACGSSSPAAPDAAHDARASGGAVTVYAPYMGDANTVTPGAIVALYDDAGNLLEHELTDSSGRATLVAPAGSSVTVLPPAASATRHYYSWYGVVPGDQLATEPVLPPVPPTGRDAPVVVARDGDDVTHYAVTGVGFSAYSGTPPATGPISLDGTLQADAPTVGDLVADATHADHHHFLVAHGVALDAVPVDLTASSWELPSPVARSIVNVPADLEWASVYYELLSGGRVLWKDGTLQSHPSATLALQIESPAQAGDGTALAVRFQRGDGGTWALSYNAPPPTIDLAMLSPVATNLTRGAGYSVSWSAAGPTNAAVAVELSLVGPVASWTIVMPPQQRAFVPPALPSDFQDSPSLPNVRVTYVSGNDAAGYPAVKQDPLVFDLYDYAQVVPAVPGVYRLAGG